MAEIEKKALALVNEVRAEIGKPFFGPDLCGETFTALCRAIEQHEAFKREVSDAVEEWHDRWIGNGEPHSYFMSLFARFILPKPVDPLVEVLADMGLKPKGGYDWASEFRMVLANRGLEVREIEG